MYLLALFIVQNLKKFFQRIHSHKDTQFLGPKWEFYLLMSLVFFIHAYLHAKNQSQILIY